MPGANANAVKELVVAGMLIAARNLSEALDFSRTLAEREDAEGFRPSRPQIEVGKKILPRLQAWQAQLVPGPKVAFTVPAPAPMENSTAGQTSKSKDEKASKAKR